MAQIVPIKFLRGSVHFELHLILFLSCGYERFKQSAYFIDQYIWSDLNPQNSWLLAVTWHLDLFGTHQYLLSRQGLGGRAPQFSWVLSVKITRSGIHWKVLFRQMYWSVCFEESCLNKLPPSRSPAHNMFNKDTHLGGWLMSIAVMLDWSARCHDLVADLFCAWEAYGWRHSSLLHCNWVSTDYKSRWLIYLLCVCLCASTVITSEGFVQSTAWPYTAASGYM